MIALRHSRDMVRNHYFAHRGSDGHSFLVDMTRVYRRGKRYRVDENLAWGEGYEASPRFIVSAWMQSPHHRRSILAAAFVRVGIGIAAGVPHDRGIPGATYTTGFGT